MKIHSREKQDTEGIVQVVNATHRIQGERRLLPYDIRKFSHSGGGDLMDYRFVSSSWSMVSLMRDSKNYWHYVG